MKTELLTLLSTLSLVTGALASTVNLDFPSINGATVFSTGQTFSFSNGPSNWNVTVTGVANGFTPSWGAFSNTSLQTLSNTNLNGAPYQNPLWPNATGVFFGHLNATTSSNSVDLTFNFTRTSGTDPLTMYVHNGESEDERSVITTSGTNWLAGPEGNVTSSYAGSTATYLGSITDSGAVGYWAAYTTFSSGNGTVSWNYGLGATPSIGHPSDMISFETNIQALPEPSAAILVGVAGLLGMFHRRRVTVI